MPGYDTRYTTRTRHGSGNARSLSHITHHSRTVYYCMSCIPSYDTRLFTKSIRPYVPPPRPFHPLSTPLSRILYPPPAPHSVSSEPSALTPLRVSDVGGGTQRYMSPAPCPRRRPEALVGRPPPTGRAPRPPPARGRVLHRHRDERRCVVNAIHVRADHVVSSYSDAVSLLQWRATPRPCAAPPPARAQARRTSRRAYHALRASYMCISPQS